MGTEVEALLSAVDVPVGTRGRVVGARRSVLGEWMLRVRWDLPPKKSEIWAQVFDFSINVPWRTKPPVVYLTKSDLGQRFRRLTQGPAT